MSDTNENVKALLVGVLEVLSDEKRWTKIELARDIDGKGVLPESGAAVCWSIYGALDYVAACKELRKGLRRETISMATVHIRRAINGYGIGYFNDHPRRKHKSVLTTINKAIKHANE